MWRNLDLSVEAARLYMRRKVMKEPVSDDETVKCFGPGSREVKNPLS